MEGGDLEGLSKGTHEVILEKKSTFNHVKAVMKRYEVNFSITTDTRMVGFFTPIPLSLVHLSFLSPSLSLSPSSFIRGRFSLKKNWADVATISLALLFFFVYLLWAIEYPEKGLHASYTDTGKKERERTRKRRRSRTRRRTRRRS